MEIKLTPDQAEKLETIMWLTDPTGHRASGRTQLLAWAYVHHSMSYQTWVKVINHGHNPYHSHMKRELLDRIMSLASTINGYSLKIRQSDNMILMEKNPPEDYSDTPLPFRRNNG